MGRASRGPRATIAPMVDMDNVTSLLEGFDLRLSEHERALLDHARAWCDHNRVPLYLVLSLIHI